MVMAQDLFSCIKSFIAVIEYGGFANAARHIYVSTPVLTKQIKLLEKIVQKKLINRTTRRLELTEAGTLYITHARRILEQITHAHDAILGLDQEPHGFITVGIPTMLNSMFFGKSLTEFLTAYPKITCNLTTENSISALTDGLADVIISIMHTQDKRFQQKKLFTCRSGIYAAPSYIKKHGVPKKVADLKQHNCLINTRVNPQHEWVFANNKKVLVHGNFSSNSGIDIYFAGMTGLGLFCSLNISVAEELKTGRLVEIQLDLPPATMAIYLYSLLSNTNNIIPLLVDHVVESTRKCSC